MSIYEHLRKLQCRVITIPLHFAGSKQIYLIRLIPVGHQVVLLKFILSFQLLIFLMDIVNSPDTHGRLM